MLERASVGIPELLDSLYRLESGRILATLIRLLEDFDLAEEAMHEAFAAALSGWPDSGVPDNPRPWLISTARFNQCEASVSRPIVMNEMPTMTPQPKARGSRGLRRIASMI